MLSICLSCLPAKAEDIEVEGEVEKFQVVGHRSKDLQNISLTEARKKLGKQQEINVHILQLLKLANGLNVSVRKDVKKLH